MTTAADDRLALLARQHAAIVELAKLDFHMWGDLGPHMTCTETDIVAGFLRAFDQDDSADALLDQHAANDDDEDDWHWRDETTGEVWTLADPGEGAMECCDSPGRPCDHRLAERIVTGQTSPAAHG